MAHRSARDVLAGRGFLLLPAAALVVHELRYRLAYGDQAGAALSSQGHGYLDSLAPWLVLLLGIALGTLVARAARAAAGDAVTRPRRSFAALWLLASVSLVAIYSVQELVEGVFADGHPAGLAGLYGHGGWWSLAAAAVLGAVVAALLRLGSAVVAAAGRLAGRRASPSNASPGRSAALCSARSTRRARRRRGGTRSSPALARSAIGGAAAARAPASHVSKGAVALRLVAGAAAVAGIAALALPGAAAAHGRGATIALDYRLRLDPATIALTGVHVRVLDGDRALEARVDPGVRAASCAGCCASR